MLQLKKFTTERPVIPFYFFFKQPSGYKNHSSLSITVLVGIGLLQLLIGA